MEVSEIIESVAIEDYIEQYVDGGYELKSGELWCISPLNPVERTPSFSIRTETQKFYDFSTGQGGNVLDFIRAKDKISVYQAIQKLKAFAGIEGLESSDPTVRLEATRVAKRYRPVPKKEVQKPKPMLDNCMDIYEFDRDKIRPWNEEGISWDVLMKRGVRYDCLANRIVYPILGYDGKIISVCGRTCDPDFKEKRIPKYIYQNKIGTLDAIYGFAEHKNEIIEKQEIILFEGAKSCMKMETWGLCNTGAILTSHMSQSQFGFLIKLASFHGVRIVMALDKDVDVFEDETVKKLCSYAKVDIVVDDEGLLKEKDSPVDQGLDNWEKLYLARRQCVTGRDFKRKKK